MINQIQIAPSVKVEKFGAVSVFISYSRFHDFKNHNMKNLTEKEISMDENRNNFYTTDDIIILL